MGAELVQFDQFLASNDASVLVELTETKGSTPRQAGTWMLVSDAATWATIGGGQLEYMAIDHGRKLLRSSQSEDQMDIPLGPEIGQCCGGRVVVRLVRVDEPIKKTLRRRLKQELSRQPVVYIFGAGHVGLALAKAMSLLPLKVKLVDSRETELSFTPDGVEPALAAVPEALVREAPPGSAFVIMTHDHALDFLICREALMRADAAYVGMIGSNTKRATFSSWVRMQDEHVAQTALEKLVCPIGGNHQGDKRPAIIAAQVTAEIIVALNGETGSKSRKNKMELSDHG